MKLVLIKGGPNILRSKGNKEEIVWRQVMELKIFLVWYHTVINPFYLVYWFCWHLAFWCTTRHHAVGTTKGHHISQTFAVVVAYVVRRFLYRFFDLIS